MTAAFGVVVLFVLGWLVVVDDPHGGEPVAVVALDRPAATRADSGDNIGIRPTVDTKEAEALPAGHAEPPADIVIRDPLASQAQPHSQNQATETSMVNGLVENGRYGPLPTISRDGRRPAEAYSRATEASTTDLPRIAIIVGGMGLSTTTTEAAIDRLPPEITLAFAPYGDEVERLADRARQSGHELALQVPLEPYDYPDNDPGPHTLLTGLSTDQNRDRLHWVMSRFSGYVGVLNYMGARFTSTDISLRPILGELRDRGLLYIDDGSSPRSIASRVSGEVGLPFAQANIVIDVEPSRTAIENQLAKLEAIAREKGFAVGVASGLPVTVETLASWADKLEGDGFVLVPASAVVQGGET